MTEAARRYAVCAFASSFDSIALSAFLISVRIKERRAELCARCFSAWRALFFACAVLATGLLGKVLEGAPLCGFDSFLSTGCAAFLMRRSMRCRMIASLSL